MSLINDMLKDLDSDTAVKADEPLPSGLQTSKPAAKRGWILPVLAALALIYALVVELNLLGLMPEKSTPPVEIPKPIALNSKWLEQGPATGAAEPVALEKITLAPEPLPLSPADAGAVVADPAVGNPAAEFSNTDTQEFAHAQEFTDKEYSADVIHSETALAVEKLLQAGAAALRESRLTTPAGDNAFQYFKSVLLLQAQNPQALAGIAQIQQNYLTWLDQALAANRRESARQYWSKARNTGVATEILMEYQTRMDTAAVDSNIPTVIETPLVKTFSVATPQFADDASAAARLARDGLVLGESRALSWLEQGAPTEQTAVVLTDLYAAQGDQAKLMYLHQLLSGRGSTATVYAQAQLAARQQNFALAAEQLAAVEFTGPAEERRLRTLAGFYQKLKDYARALPLYSKLVNMPSGGANDWLGLAVSADAQQMTSVAQNAYGNLLRLTHPDPRVMGFARQRHQDLSFSSSR